MSKGGGVEPVGPGHRAPRKMRMSFLWKHQFSEKMSTFWKISGHFHAKKKHCPNPYLVLIVPAYNHQPTQ